MNLGIKTVYRGHYTLGLLPLYKKKNHAKPQRSPFNDHLKRFWQYKIVVAWVSGCVFHFMTIIGLLKA